MVVEESLVSCSIGYFCGGEARPEILTGQVVQRVLVDLGIQVSSQRSTSICAQAPGRLEYPLPWLAGPSDNS